MYELVKNLQQEFSGELVLLQSDVKVNIVAVITEFQTYGRVPMMIPICSMPNSSHFEPDRTTLHDSMKIV